MANKNNHKLDIVLKNAEKERIELKHPYVGSEHLFLALVKDKNNLSEFLCNYNLDYQGFKNELIDVVGRPTKNNDVNLYTPLLRKIIKRYKAKNQTNNQDIYEDLFLSLLDEGEGIAIRIMLKMEVDLDDVYFTLKEKKKLVDMETSNQIGVLLNKYVDMDEKVINREEELNKIIITLTRRKKCNPLLIGPAGVGKTAIVEELARRINKDEVPEMLKNYKIFMIEMGSLISGTKYRGEFEERLNKIIKEIINNGKAIIFIDEIHSMVNAGGAEGAISASDILKPYLARGDIKCIGATTTREFNNSILKDKALMRRFDIVSIKEPSLIEMRTILEKIKEEYEKYHSIKISNNIIKKVIEYSEYYLRNISNPDKSIDLLDSACAYAKINGNGKELLESDILNTIYYKTNNHILSKAEFASKLKKDLIKIMNTKNAVKICNSFTFKPNIPISILINNSKLEEILINNFKDVNMITIDLNSYTYFSANSLVLDKLVTDNIFSSIIDKPHTLIIFKNISYANKYILNEISKINKDGFITFKYNEKIYFNNAIIIATYSNENEKLTGFSKSALKTRLPEDFVNSFQNDFRNIIEKEISYS